MSAPRTPLRPLARVLSARASGFDPAEIQRENTRKRHVDIQEKARRRAAGRLLVLGGFFVIAFVMIAGRMALLAVSNPVEPRATAPGAVISAARADIVDRQGRILATNLETHALFAHPHQIVDARAAADGLAAIFADENAETLYEQFNSDRKFLWIKRRISPEQMQAVHDIGEPGLHFASREMRLYPNGAVASHILGGATFGVEGVHAAEIVGEAGVEKQFDAYLSDPANGQSPLELSLDLSVQAASEQVLAGGMMLMNAKGATSVLMDAKTGEIISLVSLPDFDPNDRPTPPAEGEPSDSPLFNRSVHGVYELGSTFKIFTAAQAIDLGLVNQNTVINTAPPMRVGNASIGEFRNKNYGNISVSDIIVNSSNRGTGRLALQIGAERQKAFLGALGFLEPTSIELSGAARARPLWPQRWGNLSTVTISYGHGLSSSPLHLAAGYGAIANGGYRVEPTLLRRDQPMQGERVMSAAAARAAQEMLRAVVTEGTASMGDVPGYAVGGKTGTADKPRPRGGGYYEDKVIATFATIFPAHDPQYVLVVTLDEPVETSGQEPRRTAGWTAVPVAAEMIRRVGPLLGIRPQIEPVAGAAISLAQSN